MSRPLRLELAGGVYHITSRGDRREDIYIDDQDRLLWLEIFGQVCKRYNWNCYAWCQMSNHYHIVLETADANLSRHATTQWDLYAKRESQAWPGRACLSGALQSYSGRKGQLSAGAISICGT
ncbi:transposase [Collimonas pratensis]|uniref:transposase n=1 Tax=Collimonas pratensis TaxID=279113 RepID=UPI001969BA01